MGRWAQAKRRTSPPRFGGGAAGLLAAPQPETNWSAGLEGVELGATRVGDFPPGADGLRVKVYIFPGMELVWVFDWDEPGLTMTGYLGDPGDIANVVCYYLKWTGSAWTEVSGPSPAIMIEW